MRRETTADQHQCSACYGAGTRVEVHRSRYELERVLNKVGADDVFFVEADANASIQFAMHGHYVQLALPLPDPESSRFTHTPSGRRRTAAAQEKAYEQALREHWRSLVVVVRGKLQSVESGISTFEHEFDRFLVPHFAEEKKRNRKAPKAVNWLLGGSHSIAIALVAAFLVPTSAVGAFALPTNVVGHLAMPFRSSVRDDPTSGTGGANGLVLARGGWAPSNGGGSPSDAGRRLALGSDLVGSPDGQMRQPANLSSPPAAPFDVQAPASVPAPADPSGPSSGGGPQAPSAPSGPADSGKGPRSDGGGDAAAPAGGGSSTAPLPLPTGDDPLQDDPGGDSPADDSAANASNSIAPPSSSGNSSAGSAAPEPGSGSQGNQGQGNQGQGNQGQGKGQGNQGQGNGQGDQGQGNGQGNQGQGNGQGNQGQGNGQGNQGQGNQGNGQGNQGQANQGQGNQGQGNQGQGNGQGKGGK